MVVEPGLKHHAGGSRVDLATAAPRVMASLAQSAHRLRSREPLVEGLDLAAGRLPDLIGKRLCATRRRTDLAIAIEGEAYQEQFYRLFARKFSKRGVQRAPIPPVERRTWVGHQTKLVADCQSNAHLAEIERCHAHARRV